MTAWLTWSVFALCIALLTMAGWYAARDRVLDDWMLLLAVLIEIPLVVMAVRGLLSMSRIADGNERATFAAYLVSLPFIPLLTCFLALKEKTRWAMGAVAVGAFAIAVMAMRIQQIWDLHA